MKDQARHYALHPRDLDTLAQGLFNLNPNDLVRCLGRLIGVMKIMNMPIDPNFYAALLYARWSCRVSRAIRRAS